MEDSEIQSLRDRIEHAVRRRFDGLPDDARPEDYALLVGQVRALRALGRHLAGLEAGDASVQSERDRTVAAMMQLAMEMAR